MKTTIYLVRHGQSVGNLNDQFIGHTDIALTDLGRKQAQMAAAYLKDIHLDAIYSSDLERAYATACATAELKNMPVTKTAQMREIFGGKWEKEKFSQLIEKYPEDFGTWHNDFSNCRCTDGESVRELQTRIVGEVRRIAEENPGKAVAIFCHATPIRVFRAYCENNWDVPYASNASVTHAEYEDGQFKLIEYSIDHFMGDLVTALPEDV
ncbi:MAG: histidine phosphatase family protein [Oscillospiraceae bacterium]|nr:histidine phosphatase family protein [Oscillospiraceae bacterium]